MGSDIYCTLQLQKIVEQILGDVQHTAEFLSGERHSFWSALRCSIAHRLDYWLQTSYLSVVEPIATWLDSELWKILKAATGLLIPRTTTNTAWDCVLPVPVAGRGVSKTRWQVFLLEFEALDESKLLTSEP